MKESEVLAEVSNENQTLVAVVQQDQRVVYFYIYPQEAFEERFPVRACWVRNLVAAPISADNVALEQGLAPRLAAEFCRNVAGEAELDAQFISIIWSESDDGAALWYQGQLLAIIPGWSLYIDHSVCYSASCIKDNPLTLPLGSASTNTQYARAQNTRQFWRTWQQEEGNPWPALQAEYIQCYEQHFGPAIKYYAIDQGKWPPMAISQHEKEGIYYFLTLGVSIRPQPWVEILFNDDATKYRRFEMAIAIDNQYVNEDNAIHMASALAGFAHVPWGKITWLGEGHTLESEVAPQGYEGYILSSKLYDNADSLILPLQQDDPVNIYWASPVFASEREFAHSAPNGGYDLLKKLQQQGVNHIFSPRESVI
ncbi:TPA: suppressor of fused domain protein [Yersinia enterocolitica]|uniref:Suppressor of fused domain protein n=1 Tax=Yersinia enterocolitica TaxID=630 RepID=A0AAD2V2T0_YEREN|nr:suppressor of fused domain protein [Yersinia enterocolitica]AKF39008.1 Suppressor of fused protein (SUFU) [Yersinia enterocolitica]ALG44412.1 Suppressor of fused protein (SUFU) [Yersinia enterocolitica]EKN3338922.1 suppressor of fused domain protein [Yersinia enterocolitica]EKN3530351.1 suppressor of fused domain protein [Yersinia enterocolitica]EKN3611287.1 suppressor of fused domain protein [Yersinia enterocolitica]